MERGWVRRLIEDQLPIDVAWDEVVAVYMKEPLRFEIVLMKPVTEITLNLTVS